MNGVCTGQRIKIVKETFVAEKGEKNSTMTIEEMRILLQQSLKPKRYEHSVRVYKTALKMAEHYHADVNKVAVASLIHDCGKS